MPEDLEAGLRCETWKTKPTDRFILKWIKCTLSARISPRLASVPWIRPWMITLGSAFLGTVAGIVFALTWGFLAGLIAAAGQVLDGVDGQVARLTHRQSAAGAFLDSVLDRYADGVLVIGMVVYLIRTQRLLALWQVAALGALALIGSNLVSFTTARAGNLQLDLGRPTLASKGTRTAVIVVGALGSLIQPLVPLAVLLYLVVHTNGVVLYRIVRTLVSEES